MVDRLIDVGVGLDWIGPLWHLWLDWSNGPAERFSIPVEGAPSSIFIERTLRDSGVKVWGMALYHGELVFSVNCTQGDYARYLLRRIGVQIYGESK